VGHYKLKPDLPHTILFVGLATFHHTTQTLFINSTQQEAHDIQMQQHHTLWGIC